MQEILKKIESYRDQMIQLQKDLTAIPALGPENGGQGERKKADFLKEFLKNNGFDNVREYAIEDKRVESGVRPNLAVVIPGKNTKKTLWFMAHMDVVPPGDLSLWNSDPFEVVERDGKLFGRGVEDNQQGLVSSLFAVKTFVDLNITPPVNIGLLFVADEETGSKYGIDGVLRQNPDLFGPEDEFVVPDAGAPDATMVEVAEKGILWLKVTTEGKQCHASTPDEGINAFRAASFLVTRLNDLYKEFDLKDEVFDPPVSTFEPTKKEANVDNVNTIPGKDVFYVDCRVLPQISLEDVKARIAQMAKEIEEQFGVKISLQEVQREDAAPPTPVDAPVVQTLMKGIRQVYNVEPKAMGIGGGTVAAFLRRKGFHAVVWSKLDDLAHQPNEYCVIDNMVGDAKVFGYLIANME